MIVVCLMGDAYLCETRDRGETGGNHGGVTHTATLV